MSKHLVIGIGEVGKALADVLSVYRHVERLDLNKHSLWIEPSGRFQFVHLCYPWGPKFKEYTLGYVDEYLDPDNGIAVIHSTVPLGTTQAIAASSNRPFVHSPVRGRHPDIAESLKVFVKYVGGPYAEKVAEELIECGIPCHICNDSKVTEALKLWDTTIYGWNIILEKAIHEYCENHGLDFNVVYRHANVTYNVGYAELGCPQFTKYVLDHKPGPIGGHCVLPNLDLLKGWIADIIRKHGE